MSDIHFTVVDDEGTNLFDIDYMPPIGSMLHYHVDWNMLNPIIHNYSEDTIEFLKSIDGKSWTVLSVCGDVRNYRGKNIVVHFVEVKEKDNGQT